MVSPDDAATPTTAGKPAPAPVASTVPVPAAAPAPAVGWARDLDEARRLWDENAGRSYVLAFDINSEGLFGTYCVHATAGDPAHADDLAGIGAGGAICENDAEPFSGPAVGVEQLLDWAAYAIDSDGVVEFDARGVPTAIEGPHLQLTVIDLSFDVAASDGLAPGEVSIELGE